MFNEAQKEEIINEIINNPKLLNDKLLSNLKKEFISKNLNMININNIVNKNITFNSLLINEQIAFIKACLETLKWETKLNLNSWFSNQELNDYDGMIEISDEFLLSNVVKFKGFKQINNNQYIGSITVKDLALGLKNGFWSYNFDTQRRPNIIKVGSKDSDNYIKLPTVNKESVKEIKELLKNNKYNFDELKFNIRLIRGKQPQVDIKYYIDNINGNIPEELQEEFSKFCDIVVKLNPENSSSNLTLIDNIDGWHRSLATAEAVFEYYSEYGEWLEGEFPMSLYMVDVPTARDIVLQGFKRNDNVANSGTNKNRKINNSQIFFDELIKKVKKIKNKITDDWGRASKESLIYRANMEKMIRVLGIPISTVSDRNFLSEDLSEILNRILNYLYADIFNRNEADFTKNIYSKNNFSIYLTAAWLLRNEENIEEYIRYIYNLQETIIKDNVLNSITPPCNKLINYMKKIIKEIGEKND